MKWAVLVGGTGSNLKAILEYGISISLVVSHRDNVGALKIAEDYGVPAVVLLPKNYPDRAGYDQALRKVMDRFGIEAIAMAGFLRWLHPDSIQAFPYRIVNIHPSLLPAFAGLHAIEQAYAHGVRWTGVTVHFVDEGQDTGPIIAQIPVQRLSHDSLEELAFRIHRAEHWLYPRVLEAIDKGKVEVVQSEEGQRPRVYWKGDDLTWNNGHY